MQTPFDVRFDPVRNGMSWAMRGFWTLADVEALGAALLKALVGRTPPFDFEGLCDAQDYPVQSLEVSDALSRFNAMTRAHNSGAIAVVVGSTMNKLQAERALGGEGVKVCRTMEDAEAWLAERRATAR